MTVATAPSATPDAPPPSGDPGTLGGLPLGGRGLVCRVGGAPNLRRRLLEMGLLPGTEVQLVRRSALGDPLEIALRQYHLSVRLSEGEAIEVLELGADPLPAAPEVAALPPPPERPSRDRDDSPPTVLLAGNPNAGKTTVFNALTGSRARVGNYPGVTVERRVGQVQIGEGTVDLVDLPGTYSLSARSPEEQVAVEALLGHNGPRPDAVVLVVDSGALVRNLYLALQVIEAGVPVVLALNMMDEVEARGQSIDDAKLASELGCRVVPLIARTGYGLDRLQAALGKVLAQGHATDTVALPLSEASARDLDTVAAAAAQSEPDATAAQHHALARWAVLSVGDDELIGVPEALRAAALTARDAASADGRDLVQDLVQARYAYLEPRVAAVLEGGPGHGFQSWTDRIDSLLTHRLWGTLAFAVVMAGLFQLLFQGCDPVVGAIEEAVAAIQGWLGASLGPGLLTSLLVDGVVAGVGNVLVFAPQIAALFVLIGFLEDCGYLARVAFLIDRVMGGVGLHGKAFVPMLSGFACAIPAAMATRTIENRLDRLLTLLTLPFMSCSARLPVYVLMTAVAFPAGGSLLGGFSVGATVLAAMYALSVAATLIAAAILRRTVLRGPRPPLVLELPPYRMPVLRNLLTSTWHRLKKFLVDAGTIILGMTIVLWVLLTFPQRPDVDTALEAYRAAPRVEVTATPPTAEALRAPVTPEIFAGLDPEQAEGLASQVKLEASYAGRLGRTLEPAFRPLGFDWRITIGLIGSFAAREVFVSTMGIVFGIQEADEGSAPLRERMTRATWPDGRPLFTRAAGLSLMVFFVLACQCMSTIAVVKRESGSWAWTGLMVAMMTAMAYGGSLLTYQVGTALGI